MATESTNMSLSSASTCNQPDNLLPPSIAVHAADASCLAVQASKLAVHASTFGPPTPGAAPTLLPHPTEEENESVFAPTYMRNLLYRSINNLDETLCCVGRNQGPMSSLLKSCGITLELGLSKKFDISEPIDPANYYKFGIYGAIVVLLCYIGQSKRTSRLAHRFTGVAVLCAIGHFLWKLLSGVPSTWVLVFLGVCVAVLYCLRRMVN